MRLSGWPTVIPRLTSYLILGVGWRGAVWLALIRLDFSSRRRCWPALRNRMRLVPWLGSFRILCLLRRRLVLRPPSRLPLGSFRRMTLLLGSSFRKPPVWHRLTGFTLMEIRRLSMSSRSRYPLLWLRGRLGRPVLLLELTGAVERRRVAGPLSRLDLYGPRRGSLLDQ